ncbi:MAG: IS200/IS605 family transposase [Prevotellaceae bacterium]|jgi:REP element-mobilizing transposase RayT|nr:IS200/IS605 family transposase [Prevotellaceae bacterium]
MGQSLVQIYLHIVFSTKNRYPFIDGEVEKELFAYIGGIIKNHKGIPFLINGMPDHIHILCSFPRSICLSDFLKFIKGNSSFWIKSKGSQYQNFDWQDGYAAFSVSSSRKPNVENYIRNQKKHHKAIGFQEELLKFLKEYNIEYDERYLWK